MGYIIGYACAIVTAVVLTIGWAINLFKLIQCDFKPPYKAEIIRGAGVIIPPVGGIIGYLPILEEKKEEK